MSKKSWYLLGILLTIMIGMYFYWKHCCNEEIDPDVIKDDLIGIYNSDYGPLLYDASKLSIKESDVNFKMYKL